MFDSLFRDFFFQVTLGPSSRSRFTDGQLFPRHGSAKTGAPWIPDSPISPAADFDTPPEFSSCLDNSAAKHKLLIKPRKHRSSKIRRFSQVLVKIVSPLTQNQELLTGLCISNSDVIRKVGLQHGYLIGF